MTMIRNFFKRLFRKRANRSIEPAAKPLPVVAAKRFKNFGDLVASLAEREIGVREIPRDSNRGPRVEQFQAADWLSSSSGYAWCASFVCFIVREALKRVTRLPQWKRPRTAGAWDFERWAREQDLDIVLNPEDSDIERGDIVVFTFSHIGIATAQPVAGWCSTVEGNTVPGNDGNQREGGGVYARERRTKQIRSRIRLTA